MTLISTSCKKCVFTTQVNSETHKSLPLLSDAIKVKAEEEDKFACLFETDLPVCQDDKTLIITTDFKKKITVA